MTTEIRITSKLAKIIEDRAEARIKQSDTSSYEAKKNSRLWKKKTGCPVAYSYLRLMYYGSDTPSRKAYIKV